MQSFLHPSLEGLSGQRPSSVLLGAVSSGLVRNSARVRGLGARMNRYRGSREVGAGRGSGVVPRRDTGQPGDIGDRPLEEFPREVRRILASLLLSLGPCLDSHLANNGATCEQRDGGWLSFLRRLGACGSPLVLQLLSEPLSLELKIAKDGSTRTCCPSLPRSRDSATWSRRGLQGGRFEKPAA